jgi:hypothetical protein
MIVVRAGGQAVEGEIAVRARDGHRAAALQHHARTGQRLARLVDHLARDLRVALGDPLYLATVVLHFHHGLVLGHDAEGAQRDEAVGDLRGHFARAHAVAEDLHLSGHVGRQSADAIEPRRIGERGTHGGRLPSDHVGDLKHQLDFGADGRRVAVGIAHESEHHGGPARALRRIAERLHQPVAARDDQIEIVRLTRFERVGLRAHVEAERVEQRMHDRDPMRPRGNAVDAVMPLFVSRRREHGAVDGHTGVQERTLMHAVDDEALHRSSTRHG